MPINCSVHAQYVREWALTYGGDGWDEANSIIETRDGDLLVGGFVRWKEHHMWIIKLFNDGKGKWGKTYTDYYTSSSECVIQTHDSLIVSAGYTEKKRAYQSNIWVVKMDTTGKIIWEKHYGKEGDEQAKCIIETKDLGYAIAGYTTSNMDLTPNWYVLKLDSAGNVEWDKQFGSTKEDKAYSIAQTYDEGYVVTGYNSSVSGGFKTLSVIKLDKDGNDLWSRAYRINDWDVGSAIITTRDSNIVVAGYTRAFPIIDYDAIMIKLNNQGDTIWQRTYGTGNWEEATCLIETYDNSYAMGGFSMINGKEISNFIIVKYDAKGNLLWNYKFKRKSQDFAKSIAETRDNGLIMAGATFSHGKGWDYAVLKMKNIERTDLFFTFPKDSISTTIENELEFKMCLQSFGIPNNVRVLVNDSIQVNYSSFTQNSKQDEEAECDFPLNYKVKLREGRNDIIFIVKDYKNYEFRKNRVIYYIKPPEKTW